MPKEQTQENRVAAYMDELCAKFNVKNDAALARTLGYKHPELSKLRTGRTGRTGMPRFILSVHEAFGVPVKEIREAV